MLLSRRLSLLSASIAALVLMSACANAQDAGCPGKDLLAALKTKNAAAFARVRETADKAPNGKHVLWKIEHVDFPDRPVSFIYGTLNVTDPRLLPFSAAAEDAFSLSRRVAFEVEDLTEERTTEAIGVMANAMAPGASSKLDQMLGKPEATRVNVVLAKSALPKEWQPRVKPWVAFMVAARSECEMSRIKYGKLTQEGEIARQAENRGIGSFGLEAAETRLGALASLSDADQIALLSARLKTYDQLDDRSASFVQLYQARDIAALWPLQMEFDKADGVGAATLEALQLAMIEDRNTRMRDRLTMHLQYGGVFVAVSAVHLPGAKGLVELLKDAGFTLTAVE